MVSERGYMPTSKRSNWETPMEFFDYIDRQVWYQYGQRNEHGTTRQGIGFVIRPMAEGYAHG